jgi:phosphoribosylamine--glycine ligase
LVQDNKRAFEHDLGPNTGGMGSFSAANHNLPFLTNADVEQALSIMQSVLNALMDKMQEPYIGILYGGFIATAQGVFVIEFNARFGDPEALNVLAILESDFLSLCTSMVDGTLTANQVYFAPKATVCKYAVPHGYPDDPVRNVAIDISAVADKELLYLAAVNQKDDKLYATGSRTAAYVGIADTSTEAELLAEIGIAQISGPLFHRKDIGTDALINQRIASMLRLRGL